MAAKGKLIFSEEFDRLDVGYPGHRWKTSFYGGERTLVGNKELQYYVNTSFKGSSDSALGITPFSVHDGVLKLSARPVDPSDKPYLYGFNYTSGLLTSQASFQQQYGHFEIRADTPGGKGLFPAFWMLAPAQWPPEIDIFEQVGSAPGYVSNGIHGVGVKTPNHGTYTGVDMTQGFHTYAMEWTAKTLTWFIDGKQSWQAATPSDMHQPMYLLLNLAVGGKWPGNPIGVDWTKADLLVDYIRVYSLDKDAPTPAPAPPALFAVSQGIEPFDGHSRVDLKIGGANTGHVYNIADGKGGAAKVIAVFDAQRDLVLANQDDWNAVKNALVLRTPGKGVEIRNFVDVEIKVGGVDNHVEIAHVKRGTISTGAGDDDVTVTGFSDAAVNNVLKVLAGIDNDTIRFTGGGLNIARLDGGSGNDYLRIAGAAGGSLTGGAGNDRLVDISSGTVKLSGGSGADDFVFGRDAHATISDFAAGRDSVNLIGVDALQTHVGFSGGDTSIHFGGGGSLRLTGVHLSKSQLDLHLG